MTRRFLLVFWLVLGGCVTESTGGLPEPAPKPERVQAHLDLARGYLGQGDTDRARAPLETALKIDPSSADALVLMGVLHQREGDTALAEDSYKKALRYHPAHPQALNNYGALLYSEGRYQEALKPLRRLVQNPDYPARAQAYENLGLTELKLSHREQARDAFERSLSLSTVQPRSSLELADLAFQDGEVAAAQGYFDAFRVQARQTPRSLCLGMELARAEGDSNQAASYAMALKNLYPNSLEAQRCGGG